MPPKQQRPRIRTLNAPPSRGYSDRRPLRRSFSEASPLRQNEHSAPRHNATSDRKFYKKKSLTNHETPAPPPAAGAPGGRSPLRQNEHSAPRHNATSDRKFYKEGSLTGHEARGHAQALKRDTLYYVPLGGLEEIGRNCSFFEYNDEIVIIDMGIQFPEEETPGVDWIIPNTSYLEKKKKNIRALLITHGHYDH